MLWVTEREGAAWTVVLVTGISAAGRSNSADEQEEDMAKYTVFVVHWGDTFGDVDRH